VPRDPDTAAATTTRRAASAAADVLDEATTEAADAAADVLDYAPRQRDGDGAPDTVVVESAVTTAPADPTTDGATPSEERNVEDAEPGSVVVTEGATGENGSAESLEADAELGPTAVNEVAAANAAATDAGVGADDSGSILSPQRLPRWVIPAVLVFWLGLLAALAARFFWTKLSDFLLLVAVSVFLALAIEPGVNRLARRGWRRGRATALILFGFVAALLLFVVAIGTLVGTQIAELLDNSEVYITDTVDTINDAFGTQLNADDVVDDFNNPDGAVQRFIDDQRDAVVRLSVAALGGLLGLLTVMLFTYYLVADGPKMRRAICSRLRPERQEQVLATWELAATKTGGYLYSRALLALLSAVFHWIVFQSLGTAAPVALALWVGIVSQFLPVVGTYIAGVLPLLLTFLDSPVKAVIVLIAIIVYQQVENYVFSPRITARTMELHPAIAFGSALAGGAVLGAIGAVLALPAAAMATALIGGWGDRHRVIKSELTEDRHPRVWKRWAKIRKVQG